MSCRYVFLVVANVGLVADVVVVAAAVVVASADDDDDAFFMLLLLSLKYMGIQ